ncbi:MAG: hypothetical protein MUE49_06180 [Rhodospirillales bacterium]|nr:hypothetical protein [Rhodospirillales bacterium]
MAVTRPQPGIDDGDNFGGGRIAVDQVVDVGFDGGDLAGDGVAQDPETVFGDFAAGGFDLVGERGALLDQLRAQAGERAQLVENAAGGLPARQFGVAFLTVAGEAAGIDRVGFAEPAERADKRLDLAGIGAVRGHARQGGGGEQGALVAAGGLADDEAFLRQGFDKGGQHGRIVGKLGSPAAQRIEHGDAGFADITAFVRRSARAAAAARGIAFGRMMLREG